MANGTTTTTAAGPSIWDKTKRVVTSDMFPVALGKISQALMEGDQTSWQAQLGKAAVDIQRSNIAARARQRQAEERKAVNKYLTGLLSGKALTPAGTPGPTTFGITTNPDGTNKITVGGEQMFGPTRSPYSAPQSTPIKGASGTPSATTPPPAGAQAVRPMAANAPVVDPSRMLPLILASRVGGSAGTGQSLAGLTPEQMTPISRDDLAGAALQQEGIGQMYSNIVRQANADLLGAQGQVAPYTAQTNRLKAVTDAKKQVVDADMAQKLFNIKKSLAHLEGLKYNLQVQRDAALNRKDNATALKLDQELADLQRREAAQRALMESGLSLTQTNPGALIAAGTDPGVITTARQKETKSRRDAAANRTTLLTEFKDDQGAVPMAIMANEEAPNGTSTFLAWKTKGLDHKWVEVPLPVINGRQMTMKDARDQAAKARVSLDVFLDDYSEHLRARGEL